MNEKLEKIMMLYNKADKDFKASEVLLAPTIVEARQAFESARIIKNYVRDCIECPTEGLD